VAAAYPKATHVRLVLDNLNTHNDNAFYENLPAHEAFALAQRFEYFCTLGSARWLNMIEIEFSALARLPSAGASRGGEIFADCYIGPDFGLPIGSGD